MIYILTFILSILCCYFSGRLKKKQKILSIVLKVVAILLPAALAGLRALDVGTDVRFYLLDDFKAAYNSDSLAGYMEIGYGEPLFLTLVYAVTKVFSDFNVLLFVIQLMIMLFVYLGCEKHEEKIPTYLSYAFFLFVYYNMSLNLLRQSLALALAFYALSFMMDKKRIKFLILTAAAVLFHKTAFMMLPIWVAYELISRRDKLSTYVGLTAVILVGMLFFGNILQLLVNMGILEGKYLYYTGSEDVDVSLTYIGFSAAMLLIGVLFRKKAVKMDKRAKFYLFMSFLNVILLTLSLWYNTAERLTYYLGYANILLIPMVVCVLMGDMEIRKRLNAGKTAMVATACVMYFIGLSAYHVVYYMILNNHTTYPYSSTVLGIGAEGN